MARPIQHTRYVADVQIGGKLAPTLARLKRRLKDRRDLHAALASDAASRTRRWIRDAAQTRHVTAQALGATPTNYLGKRAAAVEARHDAAVADVVIKGAIFARVFRDVLVLPRRAKMLTIPVHKDSYGKRARDFENLVMKTSKKTGAIYLARKSKGGKLTPLFLLAKQALLPQDAGLLPTSKHYAKWSEAIAKQWLRDLLKA